MGVSSVCHLSCSIARSNRTIPHTTTMSCTKLALLVLALAAVALSAPAEEAFAEEAEANEKMAAGLTPEDGKEKGWGYGHAYGHHGYAHGYYGHPGYYGYGYHHARPYYQPAKPAETHSLFMPANNSSEKGSVSSILLTTSITILASPSRSLLLKLMLRLGMALRIATRDWMVLL